MSQDIYVESRHIGYAILWGLKLAFFYDGLLIFRNVIKHKDFFVYAEDFFYWIFCVFFVFDRLYEIGDGYIRWYMALGVGIGMLFYKLTLSKWLVKGCSFLLNQLKRICTKILKVFLNPFFKLARGIKRIFRYLGGRAKTVLGLFKKKLTLAVKMLKITLSKR